MASALVKAHGAVNRNKRNFYKLTEVVEIVGGSNRLEGNKMMTSQDKSGHV